MKKLFIFAYLFASIGWASDHADLLSDWQKFKTQQHEYAASETGYYAIQDKLIIQPGETAYLIVNSDKTLAHWARETQEKNSVRVTFAKEGGENALLTIPGTKPLNLFKVDKRRLKLASGLIVRVSPFTGGGLQIWLYNPDRAERKNFKGLQYFAYDETGIVNGTFQPLDKAVATPYRDSRDLDRVLYVIGHARFTVNSKNYEMPCYNTQPSWAPTEPQAFYFTDRTSNKTTYGGGRVIEFKVNGKQTGPSEITINFNHAYPFLCVHSKFFNCPLGLAKYIDAELHYGEKSLPKNSSH